MVNGEKIINISTAAIAMLDDGDAKVHQRIFKAHNWRRSRMASQTEREKTGTKETLRRKCSCSCACVRLCERDEAKRIMTEK